MEFSIPIEPDEEGYTGRECPNPECERYFKIKSSARISREVPCHRQYCGYVSSHDEFRTQAQVEFAKSIILNKLARDLIKDLKKYEVKPKRNRFLSFGIWVKGKPFPIIYYGEAELEEIITCDNCALEFAIYGTFGFCPDCGVHNSLQNLDQILSSLRI